MDYNRRLINKPVRIAVDDLYKQGNNIRKRLNTEQLDNAEKEKEFTEDVKLFIRMSDDTIDRLQKCGCPQEVQEIKNFKAMVLRERFLQKYYAKSINKGSSTSLGSVSDSNNACHYQINENTRSASRSDAIVNYDLSACCNVNQARSNGTNLSNTSNLIMNPSYSIGSNSVHFSLDRNSTHASNSCILSNTMQSNAPTMSSDVHASHFNMSNCSLTSNSVNSSIMNCGTQHSYAPTIFADNRPIYHSNKFNDYSDSSRMNSNSQYNYVSTAPDDVITVSHIDKVDASVNSNRLNSSLYAGISNAHFSSDSFLRTHIPQSDRVVLANDSMVHPLRSCGVPASTEDRYLSSQIPSSFVKFSSNFERRDHFTSAPSHNTPFYSETPFFPARTLEPIYSSHSHTHTPYSQTNNSQSQRNTVGSYPFETNVPYRTHSAHIDPASNYLLRQQLMIPSSNPFSGTGDNFHTWQAMLNARLREVLLTPFDKLQVLFNNTTGTPRAIVQDYVDGVGGHVTEHTISTIFGILSERYGSSTQSAQYIEIRVSNFPQIKSTNQKEELGRLIDLCRLIQIKMNQIPELIRYDFSDGMKLLWQKLPETLRSRWRTYGVRAKSLNNGRNPTLVVFINFLQEVYAEYNDEFFDDISINDKYKRSSKVLLTQRDDNSVSDSRKTIRDQPSGTSTKGERIIQSKQTTAEPSSEVVFSSEDKPPCPLHETSNHDLSDCRKFQRYTLKERKDVIWSKKLCFKCFGNHLAKACKVKIKCDTCNKGHHTLMHDDDFVGGQQKSHTKSFLEIEKNNSNKSLCTEICQSNSSEKICSKTLLIKIRHRDFPSRYIKAYAILDEQSSSSFVDPTVLTELHINAPNYSYSLKTLSGYETNVPGKQVDGLQVCGIKQGCWFGLPKVLTNAWIPNSKNEVATPALIEKHHHLKHLRQNFPNFEEKIPVLMLLGADSGEVMHTVCHGSRAPYAHQTPLGWALVGVACISDSSKDNALKVLKSHVSDIHLSLIATPTFSQDRCLEQDIFKEHEDDELLDLSKDDKRFISIMENHVQEHNGYLKMPLPFRQESPAMPDNKAAVYHRTKAAVQRICRDPIKQEQCFDSMNTNIKKGHVEVVPLNEREPKEKGKAWYLPVFAVTNPKKNKSRLVFDASASYQDVSLNSKLIQGPHLTNSLRAVLLRFRKGHIGLTCDIEHMFYNFYLDDSHKDYLRFFWPADNNPENDLEMYRARVHIFGASSSPAVASYGLRYAAENSSMADAQAAKQFILRSFYVDDGVTSVDSVEEAVTLLNSTKNLLAEFNINVHKFSASNPDVMEQFPKDYVAADLQQLDFEEYQPQRTLGVVWDLKKDAFIAKAEIPDTPFTKRGILAAVNSYFDPIGLAAPVILAGRLLQRNILPSKDKTTPDLQACGWDDPLPIMYYPRWKAWKKSLADAHLLFIPRCVIPKDFGQVAYRELHAFADASLEAIGIVIYLRSVNTQSRIHVALITAASRVAPKAATSVPRLELNAALQLVVTVREITKEMDLTLNSIHYYSDSKVVLGYLSNTTSNFSRYVTRRVDTITKTAPASDWRYIDTHNNPADLASRPSDPKTLAQSCWFTGPPMLQIASLSDEIAPAINFSDIELPEVKRELSTLCTKSSEKDPSCITLLAKRTSSWNFLLGVAFKILLFLQKLLNRVRYDVEKTEITKQDAIDTLIKSAQAETYCDILAALSKKSELPDKHPVSKLSPFIDCKGIMHVGGRIKNADVPFDHKHPILIPGDHPITVLLIRDLHERVGHQGRHLTHGYIRQQGYHIENGRQFLRKLISQCVLCKRLRGQLCSQQMANLPPDRLEQCPPFSNTGLDVFGPFFIYDGINTRRSKATRKMYALLLTCLVTRAVHIEPLPSMDTSSFVNALRRFFAIRGSCKRIRCDHGSNFVGAINQGPTTVNLKSLQQVTEAHNCEWLLSPPGASHFGGVWERKIASVRRVLESTIRETGNRPLSRDEMSTFLQEAACTVNSTPLYEVSSDPHDPCPITPNCLLTLKDHPQPAPIETFTENDFLHYGKRRWRRVQFLANQFWLRWRQHYINTLTLRRKWKSHKENLKIGDIVLLRVKQTPRNQWPMAIVTDVKISDDNLVRRVIIKSNGRQLERSIHDLVFLIAKSEDIPHSDSKI